MNVDIVDILNWWVNCCVKVEVSYGVWINFKWVGWVFVYIFGGKIYVVNISGVIEVYYKYVFSWVYYVLVIYKVGRGCWIFVFWIIMSVWEV